MRKTSTTKRSGDRTARDRNQASSTLEYHNWRERVAAADGKLPSRVRYTRKSTESLDRQATSHDQQATEMDKKWGKIDERHWWKDSCSGVTFDRPAFEDLLAFCKANPRSRNEPGRIEMFDPSRFGRILDEQKKPDILAFISVFNEFERQGWKVVFVTVDRTDDGLVDMILMALYAYAAALYSKNLGENVRRGRRKHAGDGYWVSGAAPWGTKRFDEGTGRVLKDRERSSPGGRRTVLVPDKEALRHWRTAAKLVIGGASLDKVGSLLFEKGVRGPRGGKMGHAALRNFLTNPALVGMVEFRDAPGPDGKRKRCRVQAKWAPMVDVATHEEVSKRLNGHRRSTSERRRRRRRRELFHLTPVCGHCGVEYNGGRLSARQGGTRGYAHARPKARMAAEAHALMEQQGCRAWYVDAEELETKVKDIVVAQRTSDEFAAEVDAMIRQRDEFRERAATAVAAAEKALADAKAEYSRLARRATAVATQIGEELDEDDELTRAMVAAKQRRRAAETDLEEANAFAASRENAWQRLQGIIKESRNLAAAWDSAGPEERRILFDYWVLDVLIVVEPIEGMKRANQKTALVRLRTAPNAPLTFELSTGLAQRSSAATASSAAHSADRTRSSGSTARRSRSAADAVGPRKRPIAQQACSRTSGSSSESAAASAGTSSGEPTLPSTTAALRFSPRNLARFMGERVNADENSAGDIASSVRARGMADMPDNTERGKNAGSEASLPNLWLYGQTA